MELSKQPINQSESIKYSILTGGSYGPEAGLIGMAFRLVILGLILLFLSKFMDKNLKKVFS